jgi:hypothetical protein
MAFVETVEKMLQLAVQNLATQTYDSMKRRLAISILIGALSSVWCGAILIRNHQGAADFQWCIRLAQHLLSGQPPYDTPMEQYPPPAALVGLAFIGMRGEIAGSLFFGISSGLLAFGLTRESYTRLWIFLAYPYWAAMVTAQWSPLIAASAFFWWLLPVVLIKPPIALPVALTHLSRRGIIASVAWLALSFAITPRWFWQWTRQLGEYHYFIPFLVFPGILILLAFLRLGNDDARLLLLAAAFPQRWFYDAFVLWLIPKSRREIVASIGASWLVGLWRWFHPPLSFAQVGRWSVVGFYLPMLAIILLRNRQARQSLPLQPKS